jgi:hypothetical protein
MCRIPKVVVLAPSDVGNDLRRKLSSLEYEIVAVVESLDDLAGTSADVVVAWAPEEETLLRLRELSLKTVAVGGQGESADMKLARDDVASFKTRVWELFRPS